MSAIPLPHPRPTKIGARSSTPGNVKRAQENILRMASAVPMPYPVSLNAGAPTEGLTVVPKTVDVSPARNPELTTVSAPTVPPVEIDVAKPSAAHPPEEQSPEIQLPDTQSTGAQPLEEQPTQSLSAEARAAEAEAIAAEAEAHTAAPERASRIGLAGKTLHAMRHFISSHTPEILSAKSGGSVVTLGVKDASLGTDVPPDTAAPSPPAPVMREQEVFSGAVTAPAAALEPTAVASAPDTSMSTYGARSEMRSFTVPRDTNVEPLMSKGTAKAAEPASIDANRPVRLAQLSTAASAIAMAMKKIPAPRRRPLSAWPRPDDLVIRDVTAPTPEGECDAAMNSGILVAQRLQRLGHRGSCMVPYALSLEAIMVGRKRVDLVPPAQLRCGFALAVANWVRAEADPTADALGSQLVGIRQLDSYNCRTMSSSRRLMSEHSMGNALDVAEFIFANHRTAHLTSPDTQKAMRYRLRSTACRRFKTVLGPGVPQHNDHVHIDLRHHFGPGGICHWNVL